MGPEAREDADEENHGQPDAGPEDQEALAGRTGRAPRTQPHRGWQRGGASPASQGWAGTAPEEESGSPGGVGTSVDIATTEPSEAGW